MTLVFDGKEWLKNQLGFTTDDQLKKWREEKQKNDPAEQKKINCDFCIQSCYDNKRTLYLLKDACFFPELKPSRSIKFSNDRIVTVTDKVFENLKNKYKWCTDF